MQTLNRAEEAALLKGVKRAVDLVDNEGYTPNDALVKVSRDSEFTPGFVRAAVSAYNNGRQVAQWREAGDALDKLASFPLADYDAIHAEIWGKDPAVKAAEDVTVSDEYNHPPHFLRDPVMEKVAHTDISALIGERQAPAVDPEHQALIDKEAADKAMRQAYHANIEARKSFEECRSMHSLAGDRVKVSVDLLTRYFKKFAMDREAFHVVDDAVQTYYGAQGRALMDCLAARLPHEKRAGASRTPTRAVCMSCEPYTLVKRAIEAARAFHRTKQALDAAEKTLEKTGETLRPFVQGRPQPQPPPETTCLISGNPIEKAGGLGSFAAGSAVATGTRNLLEKALTPKSKSELIEDDWLKLEDPDHENDLRKIRVQAMLTNMMSDPENPISGYDAESVLNAYNEVAQMAPRVAEQPAMLQPLLARRLAGATEPFEGKEIAETEKSMSQARPLTPNTKLMSDAPDSILA